MKFFNLIDHPRKFKQKAFILFLSFLFLGYLFLIWSSFKEALSQISVAFGYMDFQSNQRLLEDFLKLKMPFRDYFLEPSQGWFYLLIQSIPYLLFRRTFLAILVIRNLYLPLIGVVLSYFVAKNVLRKKHLILIFLLFCLLFKTNYEFPSPRHLMAELSLSVFILYFLKNKTEYLLLSGLIAGLAVLTSLEYAVALNLTVFFVFLATFFSGIKLRKVFFNKFLLGEIAILTPFFTWLYLGDGLKNYWQYTFGFINNFYYASPCGGNTFPRLAEVITLVLQSRWLVFNLPIEFLQRLNFYLVFIFYALSAIVLLILFLKQRRFKGDDLVKLSLVVYGLLIFLRTLNTPCLGYFVYGLVPFFLLLTFLVDQIISWSGRKKALIFKVMGILGVMIISFWFILTEQTGSLVKILGKQEKPTATELAEKEFYPPVGWYLEKDLVEKYTEITSYLVQNTSPSDFVYVYPWGPYNQLTDRPAPNSIPTTIHFLAGEQFKELTKQEIETKKPKLVVISLHHNLGMVHYGKSREDVAVYFSLEDEEGPVFSGEGDQIQRYLLENYEVVLKNDLAVVMKLRIKPIEIGKKKKEIISLENWEKEKVELSLLEKTSNPGRYRITGKNASWTLLLEKPLKISSVSIELKLDGSFLTKPLTRYFLNFYLLSPVSVGDDLVSQELAWKEWQQVKLFFRGTGEIKGVKIGIGENSGLIWWLNPNLLEIKKITFFE